MTRYTRKIKPCFLGKQVGENGKDYSLVVCELHPSMQMVKSTLFCKTKITPHKSHLDQRDYTTVEVAKNTSKYP